MRSKHKLLASAGLTAAIGVALIAANALLTGYLLQAGNSGVPLILTELQADPAVNLDDKLFLMRTREDGTAVIVEYTGGPNPVAIVRDNGVHYYRDDEANNLLKEWQQNTLVVTTGSGGMELSEPPPDALTQEEAEKIAHDAIIYKYDLKPEMFSRFTITIRHQTDGTKTFWRISYYPTDMVEYLEIGCYDVCLDSVSGEITTVTSAADGLG